VESASAPREVPSTFPAVVATMLPSGVTMGWPLRLVTGAPTGGRGPPTVLFYFKSEGRGPDLRK